MPDLWMDVDAALSEVPVNILPLLDDTDFKTRETAVAFNAAGMDLVWNFVSAAGAFTQTAVTPTSGGNYDWTHQGDGMYSIEIPSSGGASINNDTEGFGWFTGFATGVLPWRGPTIGFRAAGLNDALVESAWSATRGLSGTALPNAAAEAAGGLYTRGTGAGQINQQTNGQVDANLERWINVAPLALSSQRVQGHVGSMANDVMTAASAAADLTTELQNGLATASALTTLSNKFTGITSMAEWLGLIAGKQTGNATARTEIRATGAGSGTYDETTDSQEATRDRGDAAWTTVTAAAIRSALGLAAADLDTQLDDLAASLAIIDNFVDDLEGRLTQAISDVLAAHGLAVGKAVIAAGSTTTSVVLSTVDGAAPSATNDQFNGRVLIYTSGTLKLQAVSITDYVGGTTTLTTTASTSAPGNGTTAVIV